MNATIFIISAFAEVGARDLLRSETVDWGREGSNDIHHFPSMNREGLIIMRGLVCLMRPSLFLEGPNT